MAVPPKAGNRVPPDKRRWVPGHIGASAEPDLRADSEPIGARAPYSDGMRWPRWLAFGAFLLALAMLAGTVGLLVSYRTGAHTARNFAGLGAVALSITVLGLVISRRERRNPVGALLAWAGATAMFLAGRDVYFSVVVSDPGKVPLDSRVVAWFDESG